MIVKKVVIDKANRLYQFPPDILSFVRSDKRPSLIKKRELVDLAGFEWPVPMSDQLSRGSAPASGEKIRELQNELAGWFEAVHSVRLNPNREIFIGGSISDIMLGLATAFIDSGDIAFVPQLGIPLYRRVTAACDAEPVSYKISARDDWTPDFKRINTRLGKVARVLFLNSPHNPTGAELSEKEMAELIWLASRENIIIVNDAAYQAVSGRKPVSLMAVKGGKKVGVEVGSFAYQFGLPAYPFGFAVGSREIINGLQLASSLRRAYLPEGLVDVAMAAIRQYPGEGLKQARRHFNDSSAAANKLLELLELEKSGLDTVPFLWARIEGRRRSNSAASVLYRRSRILVAPGTGFGESGEGYLRFSLTASADSYQSAVGRVRRKLKLLKKDREL